MNSLSSNSADLHFACCRGKYNDVERLIKEGNDIEATDRFGDTYLMSACRRGSERILRLLLESGADINKKNNKGITALHLCAEYGYFPCVKLLIENEAVGNVEDSDGITPLMIAALRGKEDIVEYFINRTAFFTKEQKMDAVEVLGAALITYDNGILKAIAFWTGVLKERSQEPIVPKKIDPIPKQVYGNVLEVANAVELRRIQFDLDKLKMQALMINERIFNRHFKYAYYAILTQAWSYYNYGQYGRSFDLLIYCLELQIENHKFHRYSFDRTTGYLRELFLSNHDTIVERAQLNPTEVLYVIRKCIQGIQVFGGECLSETTDETFGSCGLDCIILNTLYVVFLSYKLMTESKKHDKMVSDLHEEMTKLAAMNIRLKDNRSILHLVLMKWYFIMQTIDGVVNLLLTSGMSLNDEDKYGNRALHYAAKYDCSLTTVDLLLQSGAHYDAANHDGDTYRSLVANRGRVQFITPNKFVTLKCLAAVTIKKFKIPFRSRVPCQLEAFINLHSCFN